jgi:fatty acid desaturase
MSARGFDISSELIESFSANVRTEIPHLTLNIAYRELHDDLKRDGAFNRSAGWLVGRIVLNTAMLAGSFILLANAQSLLMLLAAAALLALSMVQIGFIGHDAQHGQLTSNKKLQHWLSLIHWNLLTGLSAGWWTEKHVAHHAHANVPGKDPDMYALLCFSREDAPHKQGLARMIARRQVWWYIPLLSTAATYFRALSLEYLIKKRAPGSLLELGMILLHYIVFLSLVLHVAAPMQAIAFIVLSYLFTGLYMGIVFSTNHVGMPLSSGKGEHRLVAQVAHTRNVATSRLGDFLFGGLNYQIEHHLFPTLPRHQLRKASRLVKAFCDAQHLPYHCCSMAAACREIHASLHEAGMPLRSAKELPC